MSNAGSIIMTQVQENLSPKNALELSCSRIPSGDWDQYVRDHAQGTIFHLSGWGQAIERAYGYEPIFLTAQRNGRIVGLLPLIDAATPLLGRSLISTAFTIGGGVLGDDKEVELALFEEAALVGKKQRVRYVECRAGGVQAPGWRKKTGLYAGFEVKLPKEESENLKIIPRKRRAEVRKAIAAAESGTLSVRFNGEANEFYPLFAQAMHRLGTPVFPKRFLDEIVHEFGESVEIAVVEHHGMPVAALLSFYFGDRVLPYYVGAATNGKTVRAYDYLYWSAMRRASARGVEVFDFGRSKVGGGSYSYKKLWGAVPIPITYLVKLIAAGTLPNVNPNNPKFAAFARAWPHLPLSAANALGPLLAPNFP